jgi:hypothetical protein
MPAAPKLYLYISEMRHATEDRYYYCDVSINIGKEDKYVTDQCIEWDDIGQPVKRMPVDVCGYGKLDGTYNVVITKKGKVTLFKERPDGSEYVINEANYDYDFIDYADRISEEDPAWYILGYKNDSDSDSDSDSE